MKILFKRGFSLLFFTLVLFTRCRCPKDSVQSTSLKPKKQGAGYIPSVPKLFKEELKRKLDQELDKAEKEYGQKVDQLNKIYKASEERIDGLLNYVNSNLYTIALLADKSNQSENDEERKELNKCLEVLNKHKEELHQEKLKKEKKLRDERLTIIAQMPFAFDEAIEI